MKTLLIVGFLFLSLNGFNQSFKWKAMLGTNTLITTEKYDILKPTLSIDLGALMEIPFNETKFLEVGYLFSNIKGIYKRGFSYPDYIPYPPPTVIENFSANFFKVPVQILFKSKKGKSLIPGVGLFTKFNINTNRYGEVEDRPTDHYTDKIKIDTKMGNFGFGLSTSLRKGIKISEKRNMFVILYYEYNLSNFRYPTNFELEKPGYDKFWRSNIALQVAVDL